MGAARDFSAAFREKGKIRGELFSSASGYSTPIKLTH
jgi:hypothetical protein